jgi:hypothetical protein
MMTTERLGQRQVHSTTLARVADDALLGHSPSF